LVSVEVEVLVADEVTKNLIANEAVELLAHVKEVILLLLVEVADELLVVLVEVEELTTVEDDELLVLGEGAERLTLV
jgi:hypothetical protein